MGISVWCISASTLCKRHIADPHSIQLNLAHRTLAVGGLGHALLATIEIEPDPAGIARPQGNHRRPGIDQKAHRNAVDRAGGIKMPLIIRRHDDLARAIGRRSADGVLADAQRALLAADLDDDLIALDRDHFHAVERLSDRDRLRLAAVDHQHRLAAHDAGEADILRTGAPGNQAKRQRQRRTMTRQFSGHFCSHATCCHISPRSDGRSGLFCHIP